MGQGVKGREVRETLPPRSAQAAVISAAHCGLEAVGQACSVESVGGQPFQGGGRGLLSLGLASRRGPVGQRASPAFKTCLIAHLTFAGLNQGCLVWAGCTRPTGQAGGLPEAQAAQGGP